MNLRNLSGDQLIKEKLLIDKIKHSLSIKMMDEPLHNDENNKSPRCELNSPSRSTRRCLSSESDDDHFQIVNSKKSKHMNNVSGGIIHSQQIHHDKMMEIGNGMNVNATVSNGSNSSSNLNHQQQKLITAASTKYALTRYPFPPHIVRFSSKKISINRFKEFIIHYFKSTYDLNIEIVNCRSSSLKCTNDDNDLLLYVKDPKSFAFLLDHTKWPETICGEKFVFPSVPSIPPQLSLIIKNVDIKLDFVDFSNEVKKLYPDVTNVIRMKNKFGNDIKLVKLELISPETRDILLNSKKIFIHYICYDIIEYLAPVNVLICSKCCGIGHFRRQCSEAEETCKSCGESCKELKNHNCSLIIKCKHCDGNHLSNSMKCPVVKSFRDALTKSLLNNNSNNLSYSSVTTSNPINNSSYLPSANLPHLSNPWTSSKNHLDSKIDLLMSGLSQVNDTLVKLCESNKCFQHFIIEQNDHNLNVSKEIDCLKSSNSNMESDISFLKEKNDGLLKSTKEQDDMCQRLLFPMLDDMLKFADTVNRARNGRPLDADMRSRFERYRAQVSNAMEGKTYI